jgi:hypothetical protein
MHVDGIKRRDLLQECTVGEVSKLDKEYWFERRFSHFFSAFTPTK